MSYLVELVFSIINDLHLNLGILGFFSFLQILMMLPLTKNAKIWSKINFTKSVKK